MVWLSLEGYVAKLERDGRLSLQGWVAKLVVRSLGSNPDIPQKLQISNLSIGVAKKRLH